MSALSRLRELRLRSKFEPSLEIQANARQDGIVTRPFELVDVFGSEGEPLTGNPLAVISGGDEIADELMLQVTRWLNLSETTFLCAPTHPDADYRVRIFTLERELPFAGHPTLGTCHAWLRAGGKPKSAEWIVQECGTGLVKIQRSGDSLAFEAPPLVRWGEVSTADLQDAVEFLRIAPGDVVEARWIDNGPGWMGILLRSAEEVLAVQPAGRHHRRIEVGVVGPHRAGMASDFEVRALFTDNTNRVVEDPVTGSLNASIAQWLYATGRVCGGYTARQGTRVGRKGHIRLHFDVEGGTWVEGRTQTIFQGTAGSPL